MPCFTFVGHAEPDGAYTVRLVRWGEAPDRMLPVLRQIWRQRFGTDTATMLTHLLARDWTDLKAHHPLARRRGEPAPHPGIGYPAEDSDARPHHGRLGGQHLDDSRLLGYLEWMFLIDPADDSVSVFEATCHHRWLPHSRHPLDPDAGRVLGCGGHSDNGHHWLDGHIQFPHQTVAAHMCPGYHPGDLVMARLSPAAAAKASTRHHNTAADSTAYLIAHGNQVDLYWPRAAWHERIRLHHDEDGHLILAMPCWPWPFTART